MVNRLHTRLLTETLSSFPTAIILSRPRPGTGSTICGEWPVSSAGWLYTRIWGIAGSIRHENRNAGEFRCHCCPDREHRAVSLGHLCASIFRDDHQLRRPASHRHSEADATSPVPLD